MIREVNAGNLILSDIPETPAELSERLRPYQNTRFATFADWSLDGESIYVSTRFADVPQIHRVDTPGGMRRQITFGTEPLREAWRRPGHEELLVTMDVGGGEFYQLHLLDPGSGRFRLLTDGKSRNTDPKWSPDGSRLAFSSTRRNGRSNDIWIVSPDDGVARCALEAPDGSLYGAADWHPSADRLVVEQYVSITDSRIHLLDLETGELRLIVGGDGEEAGSFMAIGFGPGGTGIYFTSDRDGEFNKLAWLDLETGRVETITDAIDWNAEFGTLSPDRSRLAFTTNENGASRLYIADTESRQCRRVDEVPLGVVFGLRFSPDGRRLGFTLDSGVAPADAHSVTLADNLDTSEFTRWTASEVGGLDPASFVAPRPIAFPTFDGREIPAFLYQPAGGGPHPVIINIHGGPESQSRPLFTGVFQSWIAELGAAVIDPNVRGSSGYGKTYLKLDNGILREDSVRDIGALLDWIASQPTLDETRVMVYGGSYGGYMVLASLIHYGERLKAGVDIVGISDFVTFLENTQDYRRDLRRVEYGDEREPEMRAFFEKVSPLRNAGRIRSPLFVIQGQNDPRVPVTQAEQIVARVRANGRDVWYMNALNEGHGYARKENQDVMREAVVEFMRRYL